MSGGKIKKGPSRMSPEHRLWLLDMVDELKIHPRLAKIHGSTVDEEWEMLEQLVIEELRHREAAENPS